MSDPPQRTSSPQTSQYVFDPQQMAAAAFAASMPTAVQIQQQQHANIINSFWQNQMAEIESSTYDFKQHQLPLARIKKVMKTDEDVRAPIIFAKAAEILILELTMRAWIHAEENKRRTLQRSDIATAITKSDMFDFLIDIVPREEGYRNTHSLTSLNANVMGNSSTADSMQAAQQAAVNAAMAAAAAAAVTQQQGKTELQNLGTSADYRTMLDPAALAGYQQYYTMPNAQYAMAEPQQAVYGYPHDQVQQYYRAQMMMHHQQHPIVPSSMYQQPRYPNDYPQQSQQQMNNF